MRRQVSNAVRVLVFVAAPLTAIMIVLREPLTSVFYQYGLFSQSATDRTASTLLFFALGLGGHIVVHVLTRAYYAMQDTRTPVAWAVVAVTINVPLMAMLVGPMGVEGLALALSVASVIEVVGLLWFLRRRIESVEGTAIVRTVVRSGIAAVAAALLMLGCLTLVEGSLGGMLDNAVGRLIALLLLSAAGGAIFLLVAAALRSPELEQLRGILRRRRRGRTA
ncbi:MAG: polysaccharide biosynthesis C-terminal domain-containing protein [Chloroflexi bacterium]|nr:polysaccharide biosynthesis C-terminal domain-containing protein [Chloroflexota bacterium]